MSQTENEGGYCKKDTTDGYVGRGPNGINMTESENGERDWLGNPFTLENHSRKESIEKFEEVFVKRIKSDAEFKQSVKQLSGKRLGCWCQSIEDEKLACHAEVIATYADNNFQQ